MLAEEQVDIGDILAQEVHRVRVLMLHLRPQHVTQ